MDNKKTAIPLFFFLLCILLVSARGYLSTYDYYNRFLVTRSIVEYGTISIPERVRTVQGPDGRHYSHYALGESLLFIPFYLVGKGLAFLWGGYDPEMPEQFACSMLFPFATAATGVFIFLVSLYLGFRRRTSVVLAVIFSFATLAWPYSKMHNVQPLVSLFLLAAFYYGLKYRDGAKWSIVLALVSLAFATVVRATAVLGLFPFIYLVLAGKKKASNASLLSIAAVAMICAAFWMTYNYTRFGNIWQFGYWLDGTSITSLIAPTPIGAAGLAASPGRGIIFFMPFLILLPFTLIEFSRRKPVFLVASILLVVFYFLFYGSFSAWNGTEAWGPRYLVPIIPFLVIPFGYIIDGKSKSLKAALSVLVLFSFLNQVPPVLVSPGRYFNTMRGEVLKAEEIYTFKYAQWIRHWENVEEVSRLVREGKSEDQLFSREEMALSDDDPMDHELHNLVNNQFNFWWIYIVYFGFPAWISVASLVILFSGAAMALKALAGSLGNAGGSIDDFP